MEKPVRQRVVLEAGDCRRRMVACARQHVVPLEDPVKQDAIEEPAEPDAEQDACGADGWPLGGGGPVPEAAPVWDRASTAVVLSISPLLGASGSDQRSSSGADVLLAERSLHGRLELGLERRRVGALLPSYALGQAGALFVAGRLRDPHRLFVGGNLEMLRARDPATPVRPGNRLRLAGDAQRAKKRSVRSVTSSGFSSTMKCLASGTSSSSRAPARAACSRTAASEWPRPAPRRGAAWGPRMAPGVAPASTGRAARRRAMAARC